MEPTDGVVLDDERGKLFVGGLSWDTTYTSLLNYFSRYGQVIDCVVMKNSQTGKSRGFGFVKFADPAVLDVVLLNAPHWIDGRQVDPKICNPRSMNQGGKSTENSKRKIFVGGLPSSCDEAQLKEVFRKYGTVEEATIMYDQERNRSRGFGFLTFESEEGVDRVCNEHYIFINGKQVECKRAEPRAIKSIADTGQAPTTIVPIQLAGQPIATLIGQNGAAAMTAALANGHAPAMNGSPQTPVANPLGGTLQQHPGGSPALVAPGPFLAPAPVQLVPYPGSYGGFYCLPETALAHPAAMPRPMGMHPAEGMHGIPTLAAAPTAMQHFGFAAPAAAAGSAEAPIVASGTRASIVTVTGGACAAAAENGVATSTVNGAAAVPAQAFPQGSFQPNVTYTLAAPGMTPMPVAGTLFGTSFSHGDPGAAFIPQLPASIGRIPTNYPTGQHSFHPYRRA